MSYAIFVVGVIGDHQGTIDHFAQKPKMVTDYNLGKSSVDLSDQMTAYSSPMQKTIKMKLAMYLVKCFDDEDFISLRNCIQKKRRHELKREPGSMRNVMRNVILQSATKKIQNLGRMRAKNCTKKVATYCAEYPSSSFLCLPCFNVAHRYVHK
ncbi:uncharacterized protein LOC118446966 [Vespa mandarinia]|uniref:uncharacterized protein LOC118446966 n=1 Tax=Vespa mandarinia TaxID=7446 RepID=UPI00160DE4E9|nr:uncharacterized protein LOC118446966 [Vespa mandarinia]